MPGTGLHWQRSLSSGFLIQTGFEELAFWGYLAQAVGVCSTSPILVVGIPAVLFAGLHWGTLRTSARTPLQLVPNLLMGATYGWAAWCTGSVWLPLGMHWANNIYAVLAIGNRGDVLPSGAPLTRDLADLGVGWLIGLSVLSAALQLAAVLATPSPSSEGRPHARA